MKSLLLKDFYCIIKYFKIYIVLDILLSFFTAFSTSVPTVSFTSTYLLTMFIVSAFSFDENCSWNKLALTMPFSRKQLVKEKFLLLYIIISIGSIIGFSASTAAVLIKYGDYNIYSYLDISSDSLLALLTASISGSIVNALTFKFGAEKSRLFALLSLAVPLVIILPVYNLMNDFLIEYASSDLDIVIFLALTMIIAVIFNLLMYKLSCKIMNKKEY